MSFFLHFHVEITYFEIFHIIILKVIFELFHMPFSELKIS